MASKSTYRIATMRQLVNALGGVTWLNEHLVHAKNPCAVMRDQLHFAGRVPPGYALPVFMSLQDRGYQQADINPELFDGRLDGMRIPLKPRRRQRRSAKRVRA